MNTNMQELRVIKTEDQYYDYLEELDSLMSEIPPLGSNKSDRLELLTVLLEDFENKYFKLELPDPVDAIKFRMVEESLVQADLVKYFGRPSRVSEVLSGKRALTIDMIRKVSIGLGISTDILLGLSSTKKKSNPINWKKFPIKEMQQRGWIKKVINNSIEDSVQKFILNNLSGASEASFKRTLKGEAVSSTRQYALYAWLAGVIQKARIKKVSINLSTYKQDNIDKAFLKELARLSKDKDGPQKAIQRIEDKGILVIIEPRIEKTLLDGAALKDSDGTPVIGLTLRHDRLDNFWFTLLHELIHIWKHVKSNNEVIVDNLDNSSEDRQEAEANRLAREAFIPRIKWKRSEAYLNPSKNSVIKFANDLGIHPAIVAGRIRYDLNNYSLLSEMVVDKVQYLIDNKNNGSLI